MEKGIVLKMVKVSKSQVISGLFYGGIVVLCLVVAIFIASLVTGVAIDESFGTFFSSTLGSVNGLLEVLKRTTPLLIASLGVAVAFRSGFWNIGAEGQIIIGSIVTVGICLFLDIPAYLKILFAFIASILAGGAYAGVAGFLKAKWDVNDIVITMMLNLVAFALLTYLLVGPWHWGTLYPRTEPIPVETRFPFIKYPLNSTFILALILAFFAYFLIKKTVLGYKMRVVGDNPSAAACYGINVKRTIMLAAVISGGICALAGTSLVLGEFFRLQEGISAMYGFYAIAVALFAKNKPELIPFAALLVAIVLVGTIGLSAAGMPRRFGEIVVGLLFIIVFLPVLLKRVKWLKGG